MTTTIARPAAANPEPAVITKRSRGQRRNLMPKTLVTLLALVILFVFLVPLASMIFTSLQTMNQLVEPGAPIWPAQPATFEFEGKTRTIPARRGKIKKLEGFRAIQTALFEKKRAISTEQRNVITVAIHVGSSG